MDTLELDITKEEILAEIEGIRKAQGYWYNRLLSTDVTKEDWMAEFGGSRDGALKAMRKFAEVNEGWEYLRVSDGTGARRSVVRKVDSE